MRTVQRPWQPTTLPKQFDCCLSMKMSSNSVHEHNGNQIVGDCVHFYVVLQRAICGFELRWWTRPTGGSTRYRSGWDHDPTVSESFENFVPDLPKKVDTEEFHTSEFLNLDCWSKEISGSNSFFNDYKINEEIDHLDWCEKRINELGGKTSIFNPLWFTGSVAIGMLSSIRNNEQALGFIEETEKQVAEHLESHIKKIPITDNKTHSILKKMKSDEEQHGKTANNHGASELPKNIKKIMGITANIMKFISYRI